MNRKPIIRRVLSYSKQLVSRIERGLERDTVNLLLIVLLATAFVLKIEVLFWELTIQIPLIILGGVLYSGYYYFIVTSSKLLPKKLRWKELQTRIALSTLSMSAIIADVLISDFETPISYIKLWMALWIVIGAEALVELLAYLKSGSSRSTNTRHSIRNNIYKNQLVNRPSIRKKANPVNRQKPINGRKETPSLPQNNKSQQEPT